MVPSTAVPPYAWEIRTLPLLSSTLTRVPAALSRITVLLELGTIAWWVTVALLSVPTVKV